LTFSKLREGRAKLGTHSQGLREGEKGKGSSEGKRRREEEGGDREQPLAPSPLKKSPHIKKYSHPKQWETLCIKGARAVKIYLTFTLTYH
jgi:hypothetical protein